MIELKPIMKYVFILIIALYATRTIDRNADFKTEERFWRMTLACSQVSPKANNNMGVVYWKENNFVKAAGLFRSAVNLKPNYEDAKKNYQTVLNAIQKGIVFTY